MIKKIGSLMVIMSAFAFSGCALLLIGAAGTGGYALSKDSAEGIIEAPYDRTWKSTVKVFEKDGIIKVQDEQHGRLEAVVDEIEMKVQVDHVGKDSSRLKITGRKNLMPKAKQAEAEFVKIIQEVK